MFGFFGLSAVKIPSPRDFLVLMLDTSMQYPELLRPVLQMSVYLFFLIVALFLETKYEILKNFTCTIAYSVYIST